MLGYVRQWYYDVITTSSTPGIPYCPSTFFRKTSPKARAYHTFRFSKYFSLECSRLVPESREVMSLPKTFPLKAANGKMISIPSVGYGTWASGDNSWAKDAVLTSLREGYRHLDCAWMYGVDEAVGQAIRESGIPREEIFVTTKVDTNAHSIQN